MLFFNPNHINKELSNRPDYILNLVKLWIDGDPDGIFIEQRANGKYEVPKVFLFIASQNKRYFQCKNPKSEWFRNWINDFKSQNVPFAVVEVMNPKGVKIYQMWKEKG